MTPFPTLLAAAAWRFEHPAVLLLLATIPLVFSLLWLAFVRQRRALVTFAGSTPQSTRPSSRRAIVRIVLVSLGMASLIMTLARPQSDPIEETVTVRGRDIVFVVDVSRSMLSRDVVPDRLGRTKLWINDLVNTLRGDRIALVAFAGVPVVKCPLTLDQGFFRMELEDLSPASVPRGGTLIGDAIRKTLSDVFEPNPARYRDIILITDGEDQGSFPVEAAKAAGESGIRIIAIGIGSELEGSLVPTEGDGKKGYIEHDGSQVRSRMDSTTLAAVAQASRQAGGGGVFLNVGTGTMDLDKVYHDLIASAEQRETDNKTSVTYRELFPWFLGVAIVCLGLEPLIGYRVRVHATPAGLSARPDVVAACLGLMLCVNAARAGDVSGETPRQSGVQSTPMPTAANLYNAGRTHFLAGEYDKAAEQFREADRQTTDAALANKARFNLGQTLLKQATTPPGSKAGTDQPPRDDTKPLELLYAAAQAFRSALVADPSDAQAARNVEIARRLMQEIRDKEQTQQQSEQNKDQSKEQDKNSDKDSKGQGGDKQSGKDGKGKDDKSKQQQAEQQAQQHQQNADDLKNLAKQQQQAADKSGEAQAQQEATQKQDMANESKKQQEKVSEKTQQKQNDAGSESSQAKNKIDQARKEQQQATQALDQGDTKAAQEHQEKAAELLDNAAADESKAAEESKQQAQQTKAKEEKPKYDQQASQILEKERRQREARQQMLRALRGKPQPVEKDW